MKFAVTVLGSGSAKPTIERLSSAHVLNVHEHYFLIDCSEGTQIALLKNKIPISKIHHIFISHLHGDHYFGLIGLINTMHLSGRKQPLFIYSFPEIQQIIETQLAVSSTILSFPIQYITLQNVTSETILDNKYVTVISFPLKHRIPTCGFLFREKKRSRNIKKDFLQDKKIPIDWFPRILAGEDYIDENGICYPNETITLRPGTSRTYAYCSDTAFDENLIQYINNVSLLYHEASFCDEHEQVAEEKFHSTARQAALIAKMANAEKLLIGHFSSRYKNISHLLAQAKEEFENTITAEDGLTIEVIPPF